MTGVQTCALPIPTETIQQLADELDIHRDRWGLNRTRWSVRDIDLYKVLLEHVFFETAKSRTRSASAVEFPEDETRDPLLVAVMMPFAKEFDATYEVIRDAVDRAGLHCKRVDDIWEKDQIMKDVASLLWRAEVIVADLTGRNANVFYEVGLAHALHRKTVLLTQDAKDIPFDLKAIRYLEYSIEDIEDADGFHLRHCLEKRLRQLASE